MEHNACKIIVWIKNGQIIVDIKIGQIIVEIKIGQITVEIKNGRIIVDIKNGQIIVEIKNGQICTKEKWQQKKKYLFKPPRSKSKYLECWHRSPCMHGYRHGYSLSSQR
uniref:Uncharacterized protein n=1 Tax=Cacopsylla melanoneura TaxID=428564 RepID=A0A8D8VWJ7_9HEMI